jgi:hypothetical protein
MLRPEQLKNNSYAKIWLLAELLLNVEVVWGIKLCWLLNSCVHFKGL